MQRALWNSEEASKRDVVLILEKPTSPAGEEGKCNLECNASSSSDDTTVVAQCDNNPRIPGTDIKENGVYDVRLVIRGKE